MGYATGVKEGKKSSIARLITLIENRAQEAEQELAELYSSLGGAHVVGITGAPGSGKSSLVSRLAADYRKQGKRVGIILIDPTSPYTGGAILGDRVRMMDLTMDEGVFIRSMASRGHLGGIASATYDAVKVLDAAGYGIIFVETVGVGQSEVDIADIADTTVVLLTPGYGDGMQAMKAGIMEIADIFVVNKADLDGADRVAGEIEQMLGFAEQERKPAICKTSATTGSGIPGLREDIDAHLEYLVEEGLLEGRRKRRIGHELLSLLTGGMQALLLEEITPDIIDRIHAGTLDPYSFAREVLEKHRRGDSYKNIPLNNI